MILDGKKVATALESLLQKRLDVYKRQLIPALKQYNPGVEKSVLRMGDILREDDLFLQELAKKFIKENVTVGRCV